MYNDLAAFVRKWYRTDSFIPLHEPRLGEMDKDYVADAVDSTFVSSVGAYVDRFEKELAGYTGTERAVVTVNGTAALQVAFELAGVEEGCEVITQALTFVATANAVSYTRADPVFLDVDMETIGLSPDALEAFLERYAEKDGDRTFNKESGRRIAAVVPMHTFGHPCRMEQLMEVTKKWNLPVIEDAAEALGSWTSSSHCGTFGKMGVFSFNGNKTITTGGGGAIITNDYNLADRAKHLTTTAKVNHPWEFVHDEIGYNFRMPNLNAALGCSQLKRLDDLLNDKRELAASYERFFSEIDGYDFFKEPMGCKSNYWLNAVITPDKQKRDELLEKTNNAGIMTRPAWELMPDLAIYGHCLTDELQNARWIQERLVNLPSSARPHV